MLDGAGTLLGVTVARMNDVAVLVATASVPQSVNFGIQRVMSRRAFCG